MLRAFRHERQRDPQQPVEAKFLQNTGVQHRGRGGRRGIGFRRPGMKREKRNQNAKPDEEEEEDLILRGGGDPAIGRDGLQRAKIKAAQCRRHAAIEQDQSEKQNEAADSEVDCHLPCGREAISRAPDADEEKSRNQGQLVKGVEEKQIERSEGANRPAREEEETGIKQPLRFFDRRRKPDRAEQDERGEKKHDQAESIRT